MIFNQNIRERIKLYHVIPNIMFGYPVGESLQHDLDKFILFFNTSVKHIKSSILPTTEVNLIARGSSGAILNALYLQKLNDLFPNNTIRVIHVKKEGESSHNSILRDDMFGDGSLNIFIDDFVSSGFTIKETVRKIRLDTGNTAFSLDFIIVGRRTNKFDIERVIDNKLSKAIIGHLDSEIVKFSENAEDVK